MSLPTNELVYAGIWNVAVYYNQFQFVESPTDGLSYAYVGESVFIGGGDPATVQPSTIWIPFPTTGAGGIISLNGLTDPAMLITSTDSSVTITPIAPDKVDLKVGFPPAYGSFSFTGTQIINPLFPAIAPLVLRYDTQDIVPQGISLVLPASEELEVALGGVYKVLASVQLDRTVGGNSIIDMYPAVNGTAVPSSATKLSINQNQEDIMTVEWFLQLNTNDTVSIVLFSTDAGNQALGVPANPPVPAIPSIITTILRIA